MTGFRVFAGKEVQELTRTWRIWVLPGIVAFFAVTGPVLAKFTPQLLGAALGNQLNGIQLPVPTYADSYLQWIKNLSQIVLIAIVIVYGGLVSGEVRSGTAVLVLTKPLSRRTFVLAKAVVQSTFLAVVVALGGLVTWLLTLAIFGTAPPGPLWSATGVFLVEGVLFVALLTLLSALLGSAAGAAGLGLAGYAVLVIGAIWKPLHDYSPAGLTTLPGGLAAGQNVAAGWPVATGLVLGVALALLAAQLFQRRDL